MDISLIDHIKLSSAIQKAISKNELKLVFQPIFDIDRGVIGAEALLRWCYNEIYISPELFIGIAEKNGTIQEIGEWVLVTACATMKSWLVEQKLVDDSFYISVNLSPKQFVLGSDQSERFIEIIDGSGIGRHNIRFEITESSVANDENHMMSELVKLADNRIQIVMDDFGVGNSSLSRLKSLPFSQIKIDKSFVNDIHSNNGLAIVDAIIRIGKSLGMSVLAEGVETESQMDILKNSGCRLFQGNFLGCPVDGSEFGKFLAA